MFFNTFVLSWTEKNLVPIFDDMHSVISIPITPAASQVIDGQHRLAGLEAAVDKKPDIGEKEILVSICLNLSTEQAARIFLNINSEQKPIPKSLIYDLFGILDDGAHLSINRANDIAQELNDNQESPYYKFIKYPGTPRGVGSIDLSTVISSLKKHLETDGTFYRCNLKSLNYQKQVILNYFSAIKSFYDRNDLWLNKTKNPFLTSAGFYGAIEFLVSNLIVKCVDRKSFSVETFQDLLRLDEDLLLKENLTGLDGRTARKRIMEFLESSVLQEVPDQDEYQF